MARGNRSDSGRERTEEERERARQERARRRAAERGEAPPLDEGADEPAGEHEDSLPAAEPLGVTFEPSGVMLEPPDAAPEPPPPLPPELDVPGPPPAEEPPPVEEPPSAEEPPPAGEEEGPVDHVEADAFPEPLDRTGAEALERADVPVEAAMVDPGADVHSELDPPPDADTDAHTVLDPPAGLDTRPVIDPPAARRPIAPAARRPPGPGLPAVPPRPGVRAAPGARSGSVRRALARGVALLALVGVVIALWLLIRPLIHTKHTPKPAAPVSVKVLIPEGETRLQIAQIATADHLAGSYLTASRHSALLDPSTYGAPSHTPDLEGFLFPDTFDIDRAAPVVQLVEAQLMDFRSRFGSSQIAAARALHITPYQLLIVASMVEREAQIARDRPLIAAVIYNRLNAGMPLGIDATIYYAVELATHTPTYTKELTESELHIDSPYNTRLHDGLPPTPISNPGLASIEAAAHPAHVPYLYYVAGADGCGEQVFSTTEAQFNVDAAAYHAAVARNGGHPPTCRKK